MASTMFFRFILHVWKSTPFTLLQRASHWGFSVIETNAADDLPARSANDREITSTGNGIVAPFIARVFR
jgi:hypothetical protein